MVAADLNKLLREQLHDWRWFPNFGGREKGFIAGYAPLADELQMYVCAALEEKGHPFLFRAPIDEIEKVAVRYQSY